MEFTSTYFEEASSEHTAKTLNLVAEFLHSYADINHIIVASTTGETGLAFAEEFRKKSVVVVSHQTGFRSPNENEMDQAVRTKIEQLGAKVLTTTHAFAGVARSFRKEFNTWTPTEMMAIAFRTFGQGTKVCAEIALMAADAGLAPVGKDVLCIGGSGRGADTAWVVQPVNTMKFPDLRMRLCICKPMDF
jgi:hypothetical protein